ncbi:MAG: hypothetical protein PHF11_07695 [Candidatus Omnitrophica bacterium]|nr:hypothetical protein [Candidatus Omnitrophota bacterium]
MKTKRKKLLIAVSAAVAFIYLATVFKNGILKAVVTFAATHITGAVVHIDGFSFDIVNNTIRVKGLKVYNPEGFPENDILINIPRAQIEYDRAALLKRKLHIFFAGIDLKEISVIKNKDGLMNVNSLKFAKDGEKEEKEKPKGENMSIDLLELKIGSVIYKDLSAGEKPRVDVYNINADRTYKDVPGALQLAALLLAEPLKQTAISGVKIYGIAAVAGAAAFPAGIAAVLTGKDSVKASFNAGSAKVYAASLATLKELGKVTEMNEAKGFIKANVRQANVKLEISTVSDKKVEIVVSARLFLIPKPSTAESVLYEVSRRLK